MERFKVNLGSPVEKTEEENNKPTLPPLLRLVDLRPGSDPWLCCVGPTDGRVSHDVGRERREERQG